MNQGVKMTPPPEALPNLGRALGILAKEIMKLDKDEVLKKQGEKVPAS